MSLISQQRVVVIVLVAIVLTGWLSWRMAASPLAHTTAESPIDTPTATATPTRRVSGTVFLDHNRNRVQDDDDPGLPGVIVYLRQNDQPSLQTTTDADGRFAFSDMTPGLWLLGVEIPAGAELLSQNSNPMWVAVTSVTFLDLPFAVAFLSTPTNTPTATRTPTPQKTTLPSVRTWLPLLLAEPPAVHSWLPLVLR